MKTLSLNLTELIKYIKSHKFYCFGAGNQGRRWAFYFDELNVSKNCKGYIENNKALHGENVYGYESAFPILSLENVITSEETEICFFITSLHYEEILKQIEKKVDRKEIICISSCLVAQEQLKVSSYNEIKHEADEPIIPKVIHYAWFGGGIPDVLKRNIEGWHKMCPDFEFKKWDENNYDVFKNTYMCEAYKQKKWAFVSDYLRLDIIYRLGGIYLDTDIELVRDLEELRYQRCFGCCDASLTMNLGSGFGGIPGCGIIRELRDYYDGKSFILCDGRVDTASCNTHNFHVLRRHGFTLKDEIQTVGEMTVYPMIFQGACQYTTTRRITDKTFWIHYGNMSWM